MLLMNLNFRDENTSFGSGSFSNLKVNVQEFWIDFETGSALPLQTRFFLKWQSAT